MVVLPYTLTNRPNEEFFMILQGGRRSTVALKLMHYSAQTNTIMHTGDWSNQGEGLIVQNQEAMKPDNYTEVETLVVVTKEETPYVMKKRGRKGNAAYDGFAIDLLKVKSRLNPFE